MNNTTTLDISWHLGDRADLLALAAAPDADEAYWEGDLRVEGRVCWETYDHWSFKGAPPFRAGKEHTPRYSLWRGSASVLREVLWRAENGMICTPPQ